MLLFAEFQLSNGWRTHQIRRFPAKFSRDGNTEFITEQTGIYRAVTGIDTSVSGNWECSSPGDDRRISLTR